jgi:hypothetical protein
MAKLIVLGVLIILISGCATGLEWVAPALSSPDEIDRSLVNQPSMDLRARPTPPVQAKITSFRSLSDATASGGCSVCAH